MKELGKEKNVSEWLNVESVCLNITINNETYQSNMNCCRMMTRECIEHEVTELLGRILNFRTGETNK